MTEDQMNPEDRSRPLSTKEWLEQMKKQNYVKPGSPEHENLLAAGYGMTIEEAKAIVAARSKDIHSHSTDEVRKAEAMIKAFNAGEPVIQAKREHWHRPVSSGT